MDGGTGHCLCGAIGFRFDGAPNWQAHCHCESCRRATSSPFTSYFGVDHGKWRWTSASPAVFASSPGVRRHFCATCGSPMAFESTCWPQEINFFAASLDDPTTFAAALHVHWNERLPWVTLADGVPVHRSPRRLTAADEVGPVLALIRSSFAYMDGIIDPPSSAHHLTGESLVQQARDGELWVIEDLGKPIACVVLSPATDHLYLGKLAVADGFRGQGLARQLVDLAGERAAALGCACVELQVRVELGSNHAAFEAMGFRKVAETAHPGYDRPTSFTFRRALTPGPEPR